MREEVTFRPKLHTTAFQAALSTVFVLAGILLIRKGDDFVGWSSVVFFGMCLVVFVIKMLPNASYLRLTREGFEFCALFRKTSFSWLDVHNFGEVELSDTLKTVGFDLQGGQAKPESKRLRKINSAISGREMALPDSYGMKATELAMIMEEWRSKRASDKYRRHFE